MRIVVLTFALAVALVVGILTFVFAAFDGFVTNPVLRIGSGAAAGLCGFFVVALIDLLAIQIRGRGIVP